MPRACGFILIAFLSAGAFAEAESTAPPDPKPLDWLQGYLVLDLLLKQKVSRIVFKQGTLGELALGPYESGRHLVLLPATRGNYKLSEVASPSYNLPFLQSYSGLDRLRFKILPGRTNYIAQIIVGDIRSSYGFEIHVRNRLAYTYDELMKKYGPVLAQYPIHYAGPITDHFYNDFLKPPEMEAADE